VEVGTSKSPGRGGCQGRTISLKAAVHLERVLRALIKKKKKKKPVPLSLYISNTTFGRNSSKLLIRNL
jgi:hypothetical protein